LAFALNVYCREVNIEFIPPLLWWLAQQRWRRRKPEGKKSPSGFTFFISLITMIDTDYNDLIRAISTNQRNQ
jgi:hypothetical protein